MKSINSGSTKSMIKNCSRPDLGYRESVDAANDIIELVLPTLDSLPFDSRLSGKDYKSCVTALVTSRILKKFVPKSETTVDLRSTAFINFQEYDEALCARMVDFKFNQDYRLSTIRRRLLDMCKSFSIDYTDEDIDVGPGETYHNNSGHTQMISKLSDLSHWTTTANCLDETYLLIYHNRSLKRLAKQHIGHVSCTERAMLYNRHRCHPTPGFAVFCDLLDKILQVVPGSRGASVPKNNETDRFINIEPFFPMLLQRMVAKGLLRCLKASGYPLDGNLPGSSYSFGDRQAIHKQMISRSWYSTIDFSNASDSVCLNVIQSLFPQKIVSLLEKHRSHHVMLDGTPFELFKLSSMGNGFTFEVMTLLLLATCRVFTNDCSVFGDDVIIPNEFADEFLKLTEILGFRPNNKKTFIKSNFRESCGSFFHDDAGYLTSFDFIRCETYNDVIITHNKLVLILQHHGFDLHGHVLMGLVRIREKLAELIPLSRRGPLPVSRNVSLQNIAEFAFDTKKIQYKHMRNSVLKDRYKLWVDKIRLVFADLELDTKGWLVVTGCEYKAERSTRIRTALAIQQVRLHSLREPIETVRGKGKWRDTLLLVEASTGRSMRLSQFLLDYKKRRKANINSPVYLVKGRHNEHVNAYRAHLSQRLRTSGAG